MSRIVLVPLVALGLAAATLPAQDTTRLMRGHKSPTMARVIGIVPGAGHVYAGETMRGVAHFATTAGIFLLSGLALATECVAAENCDEGTGATLVVLAGFAYWGWTVYDAGLAAERANARRGPIRLSLIAAPVGSSAAGGVTRRRMKLGLSVAGR